MTQQIEHNEDKLLFEEIKKIISENDILETSDKITQMYGIGNHKAVVVVTRDNSGNVISTFCKIGNKLKTFQSSAFNEQDFALEISDLCSKKSTKINNHINKPTRSR